MIVITLLQSFTQEEWEALGKFIKSSSKSKKHFDLWKAINKTFPVVNSLTKEELSKRLKIRTTYLNKLLSEFKDLVDQFLLLQSDPTILNLLLAQQYQQRGLTDLVEKQLDKTQNELQKQKYTTNIPVFLYDFLLERIKYEHINTVSKANRSQNTNIQKVLKTVDVFYVVEQLKHNIYFFTINSIYGVSINTKTIERILRFAHDPSFQDHAEIVVLRQLLQLFYQKQEKDFDTFLTVLDKHKKVLSSSLLEEIYVASTNYCNQQYAYQANTTYLKATFEIYQRMRSDNLLFLNKPSIFIHLYPNMAVAAAKLGVYDWAISFTEIYKNYLPENIKDGLYYVNLAAIAFYKKNYETALDYAYRMSNIDAFYHINQEMLIIKSLYLLEKTDELEAKLHTFLSYISYREQKSKKQQIAQKRLLAYKNFLKIMKRLKSVLDNRQNPNYDSEHGLIILSNIETDIKEMTLIIDKSWLLHEINALRQIWLSFA